MDRESFFISELQKQNITYGLGDDGIRVEGKVYAMDLFCEGVHFLRNSFSYYAIAKKAMLVNISDILAMGAMPKYALLGISFSNDMSLNNIKELINGFSDICKEYKIKIIGGDTIKSPKLNIAITMIGENKGKEILRNKFKANDLLCITGNIGSVAKDMRYIYRGGKIPKTSKFLNPKLNAKFIYDTKKFIKGGMDISDGLFYELNRISAINNVKFSFFNGIKGNRLERCKISKLTISKLTMLDRMMAVSGEEYELLFSINIKDYRKLKMIAKKDRVKVRILGKILRGRQRFFLKGHHK